MIDNCLPFPDAESPDFIPHGIKASLYRPFLFFKRIRNFFQNPKPETRNPLFFTLNPKPYTLNPKKKGSKKNAISLKKLKM